MNDYVRINKEDLTSMIDTLSYLTDTLRKIRNSKEFKDSIRISASYPMHDVEAWTKLIDFTEVIESGKLNGIYKAREEMLALEKLPNYFD